MSVKATPEPGVPAPFQVVKMRPEMVSQGKISTRLLGTGSLTLNVTVATEGGENNLHAHSAQDAIWMVLDGQATFYTTDDAVVARLEQYDSLLIPHGVPYWFESSGDKPLVVLRFASMVEGIEHKRVDYTPRRKISAEVLAGTYFSGSP